MREPGDMGTQRTMMMHKGKTGALSREVAAGAWCGGRSGAGSCLCEVAADYSFCGFGAPVLVSDLQSEGDNSILCRNPS